MLIYIYIYWLVYYYPSSILLWMTGTLCSRTVCQTTRCVQESMSLHPLAFTRVPPDMAASKLIATARCLEI